VFSKGTNRCTRIWAWEGTRRVVLDGMSFRTTSGSNRSSKSTNIRLCQPNHNSSFYYSVHSGETWLEANEEDGDSFVRSYTTIFIDSIFIDSK
jgi:hypothetical protein